MQRVVAPWSRHGLRRSWWSTERCASRSATCAVLDGVAFDVAPGEFVVDGRAQRVREVARCSTSSPGWSIPTAGGVLVDGDDATGRIDPFAYMPQQDLLFPWRTVLDNTTLGLEVAGVAAGAGAAPGRGAVRAVRAGRLRAGPPRRAVRRDAAAGGAAAHGGAGPCGAAARRAVRRARLAHPHRHADLAGRRPRGLRVDGPADHPRHPRGGVPVGPGGGARPAPGPGGGEVDVDLPRPRAAELVTTPRFAHVEQEVRAALHES